MMTQVKKEKTPMFANVFAVVVMVSLMAYMVKCAYSIEPEPPRRFDEIDALTAVEELLKKNLNDPDSYDREEWKANLVDDKSRKYRVTLRYRAKNGFGGVVLRKAVADVDSTWYVTFQKFE